MIDKDKKKKSGNTEMYIMIIVVVVLVAGCGFCMMKKVKGDKSAKPKINKDIGMMAMQGMQMKDDGDDNFEDNLDPANDLKKFDNPLDNSVARMVENPFDQMAAHNPSSALPKVDAPEDVWG
jgi:hypothetical protein